MSDRESPIAAQRWRCSGCGNLTRFDVTRTPGVRPSSGTSTWPANARWRRPSCSTRPSRPSPAAGAAGPTRSSWSARHAVLDRAEQSAAAVPLARAPGAGAGPGRRADRRGAAGRRPTPAGAAAGRVVRTRSGGPASAARRSARRSRPTTSSAGGSATQVGIGDGAARGPEDEAPAEVAARAWLTRGPRGGPTSWPRPSPGSRSSQPWRRTSHSELERLRAKLADAEQAASRPACRAPSRRSRS